MKVLDKSEKMTYNAVMSTIVWEKKKDPVKKDPFGKDDKW